MAEISCDFSLHGEWGDASSVEPDPGGCGSAGADGTCPGTADQQFAERPDQGINAVRRIPGRGPVDIRSKICHLVFELREGADVMDAALVVERRRNLARDRLFAGGDWIRTSSTRAQ